METKAKNGRIRWFVFIALIILLGILAFVIQIYSTYKSIQEIEITTPAGKTVIGTEVKIPEEAPKDLPIYPPGKIASVISAGKMIVISIETPDQPKSVFDWYKIELKKNNWVIRSETLEKGTGVLWFENQKYEGQVTTSNRNHSDPENPTKITRINISVENK